MMRTSVKSTNTQKSSQQETNLLMTVLVIGTNEREKEALQQLVDSAQSRYDVHFIPSLQAIPPRSAFDPEIIVLTSDLSSHSLTFPPDKGHWQGRFVLFVTEETWGQTHAHAPLEVVSHRASAKEIAFRLHNAFQRKNRHLVERLGLSDWAKSGQGWNMLPALDWVTGLHNRVRFLQELEKTFSQAKRYKRPLSCLLLRFDSYTHLRDAIGDEVMDDVVEDLAGILDMSIRDADILARVEEGMFGFILPETDQTNAEHAIQRIQQSLLQAPHTTQYDLHFSFGLASLNHNQQPIEPRGLLEQAEEALHSKNKPTKNR